MSLQYLKDLWDEKSRRHTGSRRLCCATAPTCSAPTCASPTSAVATPARRLEETDPLDGQKQAGSVGKGQRRRPGQHQGGRLRHPVPG